MALPEKAGAEGIAPPGQGVTVSENSPFVINEENMETYNYWLAGYIYYDDAPLTGAIDSNPGNGCRGNKPLSAAV